MISKHHKIFITVCVWEVYALLNAVMLGFGHNNVAESGLQLLLATWHARALVCVKEIIEASIATK